MKNEENLISKIVSVMVMILFWVCGMPAFINIRADSVPSVKYTTYVQTQGWSSTYRSDGKSSGTTGMGLNLQALKVKIVNDDKLGVRYSCCIHNSGWQNSVKNNKISGSINDSDYIETIKMKLTGDDAYKYDIYYKVSVRGLGWLDWAKNDIEAGTVGLNKAIQAIKIVLVEKGGTAPGEVSNPCKYVEPNISYRTYNKESDWSNWIDNRTVNDDSIDDLYVLDGMELKLSSLRYKGGVSYRSLIRNKGWQEPCSDGNTSGILDEDSNLEAVKINLTGDISNHYYIYYRVYVDNVGWLDWAKDGEPSGSSGYSYNIKALQIKLVNKDDDIRLNSINHYMSQCNTTDDEDTEYLEWNSDLNELNIYRKASEKNSYIRQSFRHVTRYSKTKKNAIKSNPLASCYDIWSLRGAYICAMNEDGKTFTDVYKYPVIHDDAEWEMAIKQIIGSSATPDFVGGVSHGNEFVNNITFEVDGKEYNLDNIEELNGVKCKKIEIKRYSNVYQDNTLELADDFNPLTDTPIEGNQIATHYVDYEITHDGIIIDQDLNWLIDVNCDYSCMAMLGVKRVTGDGITQVTDSGTREGDSTVYDCSKPGIKDGIFKSKPNCKSVHLWNSGKYGGLNCDFTAEVLAETPTNNKNVKVSYHNLYNKIYFAYCTENQTAQAGTTWNSKARYTIDFKGGF